MPVMRGSAVTGCLCGVQPGERPGSDNTLAGQVHPADDWPEPRPGGRGRRHRAPGPEHGPRVWSSLSTPQHHSTAERLAAGWGLRMSLWWVSQDGEPQGGCLRRGEVSYTGPHPGSPLTPSCMGLLGTPAQPPFLAPRRVLLVVTLLSVSPSGLGASGGQDYAHLVLDPSPTPRPYMPSSPGVQGV